ncbi:MAG: winged helix-turn-helix domain-containing protein [Lysobacteraceae bacterium]
MGNRVIYFGCRIIALDGFTIPWSNVANTLADDSMQSQRLNLGPWRIDLARETVIADDDHGKLHPRAESLLLLLCRHANELVTREQIHENVWSGRIVEDAAISNSIWQIRKALGDQGRHVLQTWPKRGYLLAIPESAWVTILDGADAAAAEEPRSGDDAPTPHDEDSGAAIVARVPPPRRRLFVSVAVVALILALSAAVAWKTYSDKEARIALRPDAEMTVAVIAPETLEWLRSAVLRVAVEHAYLRDSEVVVFQKLQRRNPFAGPHLQVWIKSERAGQLEAEISLAQGRTTIRKRFHGPAGGLAATLETLLTRALTKSVKRPTPASDAFVSGLVAELQFDNPTALAEFGRAIARDPGMPDAKIAMARVYLEQGRWKDALNLTDGLTADPALKPHQRCMISVLLADAAPEKLGGEVCPRAASLVKLNRLELRDLIRELRRTRGLPKSATQWQAESTLGVIAHLRLQELALAETDIAEIERIARDAGWEHVVAELDSGRSMVAIYQGRAEDSIRLQSSAADRMAAIGDIDSALYHRIWAIRSMQIAPGPAVDARRKELQTIVENAKAIGNVDSELGALDALMRLERDRPDVWQRLAVRIRALSADAHTAEMRANDLYKLLDETRAMRRYREVLSAVASLEQQGTTQTQDQIWNLTLKAESHFARDELVAAVDAVTAMEKENFDIADTSSLCLFSWLFVEARMPDRARAFIRQCQAKTYDRQAQASRGDFGLIAIARQLMLEGDAAKAWSVLKPRIDALIATHELTRQEAESLTALARHAVSMPGADHRSLQRALAATEAISRLDGAGPGLRLGVHLLRWRLCATSLTSDCGPVVPPWAQEDLLEARLAREGVNGTTASRQPGTPTSI